MATSTTTKPNKRTLDKAFKLLALAERGIDGEKENATRLLTNLLGKYGMTINDLKAMSAPVATKRTPAKEFILWDGELNVELLRRIKIFMTSDYDLNSLLMHMLGSIMVYGPKARRSQHHGDARRIWKILTGIIKIQNHLKEFNWSGKSFNDLPAIPTKVAMVIADLLKHGIMEGRPYDVRNKNFYGKETNATIKEFLHEIVALYEFHMPALFEKTADAVLVQRVKKVTSEIYLFIGWALNLYHNEDGHLYESYGAKK